MAAPGGRHALVTGGCGTIGRAFCAALAAAGARVTVLDRPQAAPLPGHGFLGVDLEDTAAAQATVAEFAAADPVDILINNAALILNGPADAVDLPDYDRQVRINSTAAFALSQVCARGMAARGWGRIINMTSVTLNGQWDGFVPYLASKGAMLGLTKGLARELGPQGITVNAIAPGAVRSEAEDRVFADRLEDYNAFILNGQSVKRRIAATDIAPLAVFLCSDGAAFITGQNIGVDGGW